MDKQHESLRSHLLNWQAYQPDNADIVAAFSSSNKLKLFCIVNTRKDGQYILAESRYYANIISKMSGHIEHVNNGGWRDVNTKSCRISESFFRAVAQAINDRIPGIISKVDDFVVMQHNVYDSSGRKDLETSGILPKSKINVKW